MSLKTDDGMNWATAPIIRQRFIITIEAPEDAKYSEEDIKEIIPFSDLRIVTVKEIQQGEIPA
jgi:hypothetical protein